MNSRKVTFGGSWFGPLSFSRVRFYANWWKGKSWVCTLANGRNKHADLTEAMAGAPHPAGNPCLSCGKRRAWLRSFTRRSTSTPTQDLVDVFFLVAPGVSQVTLNRWFELVVWGIEPLLLVQIE